MSKSNVSHVNFSDFISQFQLHSKITYLQYIKEWRDKNAKTRWLIFEQFGVKWSPLLYFSYIDLIRFSIVDLMYNLFLESTKRFMKKAWRNDNNHLINNNQL